MSYSNRELVEFFVSDKLSQRNYPTSLLRPEDAGGRTDGDKANSASSNGLLVNSRGGIEAVKSALKDAADEFELLFTQAFSDLSSQLDITPETAYHSFKSVMDEVFKDGVNWGRIVGLFCFGGVLCVECVEKNMSELVPRIADWMTMYLDEHISPWIQSQGGWECFAEIFGQNAAAEARRSRDTLKRWLLVGGVLLMGVLAGVLIAKKQ
ncbi:bcl-2-like protein 1 [Amphiprion ocellaris]|uniref:Bcl-2 Bcl-2 homology region 1-3 domain-containing protein n=1 Tax=Amphiprion ocellaris TaxID=80972 RepID=A0A3Q1BQA0_AMPOC|nr:bcl-2-like protein 1 [Amphiprion ocellaris]